MSEKFSSGMKNSKQTIKTNFLLADLEGCPEDRKPTSFKYIILLIIYRRLFFIFKLNTNVFKKSFFSLELRTQHLMDS